MKLIYTTSIAILLLSIISCKDETNKGITSVQTVTTEQNYITQKPTSVNYANETTATGSLANKNEYQLSFMVGGIINYLNVNEGDYVKKGQILAKINQTSVKVATERLTLNYDKAKRDYARVEALYKDQVVTLENLQNAKTGLDNARLQLKSAQFSKQYASIKAPNSGVVLSVLAQKNEMTQAGNPIIIMGSNKGGKVLKTSLADIDIVNVRKNDKCEISFDAFPNQVFEGFISEISSTSDRYTGTYDIEINVKDPNRKLLSGLVGKVIIQSNTKNEFLQIPIEALISADKMIGKINVLVNDTKEMKTVKIAKILGEKLLISEGISKNDIILVN